MVPALNDYHYQSLHGSYCAPRSGINPLLLLHLMKPNGTSNCLEKPEWFDSQANAATGGSIMVRTCEEAVTKTKIAIVEQTEAQYPPSDPIPIVTSKLLHDLFTDDQLLLTDEEASLISVDALSCVWDTPEEDKAWAGM